MVFKRRSRIETEQAKQLRHTRKHFAEPGGSHDRLVKFLAMALPMGVGVVAALMVVTPLSPRGEVSFLLDRKKVAVVNERLSSSAALYRGTDNKGQPFSLSAGNAIQRSSEEGIVRMQNLVASILLPDGPARLQAPGGTYNIANEMVRVPGTVQMTAADGYAMMVSNVSINLADRLVTGQGGVSGSTPAGTFSANRLEADIAARTLSLIGNARLHMIPGKVNQMRMP
ncbi:MAG: LPS export ABC transporter periplasmic protein LptC [Sphingomonadaceae bacterium]